MHAFMACERFLPRAGRKCTVAILCAADPEIEVVARVLVPSNSCQNRSSIVQALQPRTCRRHSLNDTVSAGRVIPYRYGPSRSLDRRRMET